MLFAPLDADSIAAFSAIVNGDPVTASTLPHVSTDRTEVGTSTYLSVHNMTVKEFLAIVAPSTAPPILHSRLDAMRSAVQYEDPNMVILVPYVGGIYSPSKCGLDRDNDHKHSDKRCGVPIHRLLMTAHSLHSLLPLPPPDRPRDDRSIFLPWYNAITRKPVQPLHPFSSLSPTPTPPR